MDQECLVNSIWEYMGIKNLASNRRDIGIAAKLRTMGGGRRDNYGVDSALTSSREMGTFARVPPCCEGITEVRTAIEDHLRHPGGIWPDLT